MQIPSRLPARPHQFRVSPKLWVENSLEETSPRCAFLGLKISKWVNRVGGEVTSGPYQEARDYPVEAR